MLGSSSADGVENSVSPVGASLPVVEQRSVILRVAT